MTLPTAALVGAFVSATGLSTFHSAPTSWHAVIAGFIFGVECR